MPPEHHFSQPQHPGPRCWTITQLPSAFTLPTYSPTSSKSSRYLWGRKECKWCKQGQLILHRSLSNSLGWSQGYQSFHALPCQQWRAELCQDITHHKHNHCCLCNNAIPKVPTGMCVQRCQQMPIKGLGGQGQVML